MFEFGVGLSLAGAVAAAAGGRADAGEVEGGEEPADEHGDGGCAHDAAGDGVVLVEGFAEAVGVGGVAGLCGFPEGVEGELHAGREDEEFVGDEADGDGHDDGAGEHRPGPRAGLFAEFGEGEAEGEEGEGGTDELDEVAEGEEFGADVAGDDEPVVFGVLCELGGGGGEVADGGEEDASGDTGCDEAAEPDGEGEEVDDLTDSECLCHAAV